VPDWVLQILGIAGSGAAVYAGIRADLAAMRERIETLTSGMNHAHRRIDDLLMRGEK
jgi:hypothetical protein